MLRANRHILFDQGHEVWWIFDNTRGEIESPQVEGWVKPQEVSSPIWDGDGLFVYSTCSPNVSSSLFML